MTWTSIPVDDDPLLKTKAPPEPPPKFGLASLVAPMALDEFMKDYFGKRVLRQRGGGDRYAHLLTFDDLNHILRDHRLTHPRFRLTRAGETLPETAYTHVGRTLRGPLKQVRVAKLIEELRSGATLVLDAVDQLHPPVRVIKDALERDLDAQVWVNTYASWRTTNGLPYHWDDHDTIILQVKGRKRWRLHPPTLPAPTCDEVHLTPKPEGYTMEVVLEAGNMLYVPRGVWHLVEPMDEPTIHLTIGVLRPTNADFFTWLLTRLKRESFVREDVPLGLDADSRRAHTERLRAIVHAALDEDVIDEFLRAQRDAHGLDPSPSLHVVEERDATRWNLAVRAVLLSTRADVTERGEDAILRIAGTTWTAPRAAARVLRALAAGEELTMGALLEVLSARLVSELVSAGLLAVR